MHQQSNILVIGVNVTIVRKNKRVEKDLSQVDYFSYHKKGNYINNYLNK